MIEVLLILLLVRSLINNVAVFLIIRNLIYSRQYSRQALQGKTLYIILPVVQEDKVITETLEYISECIRGLDNIFVYVVGNSKERNSGGINLTLEQAEKALNQDSRFKVLELISQNGAMAHQVNFAINDILHRDYEVNNSWIFLVNVDSRFSKEGLYGLIHHINNGTAIIQQSALFLSNFRDIGYLPRGLALFQSRWTLSHEIKRIWFHGLSSYFSAHVVGHGLCINLATLLEYRKLPEDTITEDLHFGYYLAAAGEQIEHLHVLELADSPQTLFEGLKQKYVWSFGPMLYPKYLMHYIDKFPEKWRKNRLRAIVIALQGTTAYINWLISSWLTLYFLYIATHFPLAAIFLILYFFEYIQCVLFFYQRSYIALIDVVLSPVSIIFNILLHSVPANKALLDYLLRRTITKYKTYHG